MVAIDTAIEMGCSIRYSREYSTGEAISSICTI